MIEVAGSSVGYDRGRKAPLYAVSGIPEYWLVDVVTGQVEVYRAPTPSGYSAVRTCRKGDILTPISFPDLQVAVQSILP